MASNIKMIKKLQWAINWYSDVKILYTTNQFFSKVQNRPVTKYCLKKAIVEEGANQVTEIFSTYSQLQVVMFLRDLWYVYLDKELPTDNELWENIKEKEGITLKTYKDVIK